MVTSLRRLLARGGDTGRPHQHAREPGDGTVPGWDAITDACTLAYGSEEPQHWGTIRRWRQGGPDPFVELSAHRAAQQRDCSVPRPAPRSRSPWDRLR
jgi:hypothetical protein